MSFGAMFDMFRLEEKRWVELTSLGDKVLILGDQCAFSALDSCVGRGNCVIYRGDFFLALDDGMRVFRTTSN